MPVYVRYAHKAEKHTIDLGVARDRVLIAKDCVAVTILDKGTGNFTLHFIFYDGTELKLTSYGPTLASGKIGMARSFDGIDDHIETPHSDSLLFTKEIAIFLWIKPKKVDDYISLVTKQAWHIYLRQDPGAGLYWITRYTDDTYDVIAGTNVNWYAVDEWVFVGGSTNLNVNRQRLWVNGEIKSEETTKSGKTITQTTAPLWVGKGPNLYFSGLVDEVRILTREPSEAEVTRLMYLRGI